MKSKPLLQLPEQSAFQLVRQEPTIFVNDAPISVCDAQSNKDTLSRKNSVIDACRENWFKQSKVSPQIFGQRPRMNMDIFNSRLHNRGFGNFDTLSRNSSQKSLHHMNPKSIGNTP